MADPAPGITATPHEDNLRYFDVVISGPSQSPFEGKYLFLTYTLIELSFDRHVVRRRLVQARALSSRGVSHGTSKGPVPH